jgi:predicted DNA-binding protein (MmcQ/YjbR family)
MAKARGSSLDAAIREIALAYPETVEEFPWGHSAYKVKGKTFLFAGANDDGRFSISVKLPQSRDIAIDLPFTEPTHYGLGKAGWVTAYLDDPKTAPLDLIKAWIDESYRAIAPKKLVKLLSD